MKNTELTVDYLLDYLHSNAPAIVAAVDDLGLELKSVVYSAIEHALEQRASELHEEKVVES